MSFVSVAMAALVFVAGPGLDTVYLRDGGRLRGTVVEELPGTGVTVQLPGGELRKVPAADVLRVEYAEAAQGGAGGAPAAPADVEGAPPVDSPLPPIEPGAPPGSPASAEPVVPDPLTHPRAITLAGLVGFAAPSGEAEPGLKLSDVATTEFLMGIEAALRLMPALQLGLSLDLGIGGAGELLERDCAAAGFSCSTTGIYLGAFARWAFTPTASGTPWAGIGVATGILSIDPDDDAYCGYAYGGNQLRLQAGYDFRRNGQLGFGVFAGAAFGRYTDVGLYDASCQNFEYYSLPDTASHTWIQGGVRAILFP